MKFLGWDMDLSFFGVRFALGCACRVDINLRGRTNPGADRQVFVDTTTRIDRTGGRIERARDWRSTDEDHAGVVT